MLTQNLNHDHAIVGRTLKPLDYSTDDITFSAIPATFSALAIVPVTSLPGYENKANRLTFPSPSLAYNEKGFLATHTYITTCYILTSLHPSHTFWSIMKSQIIKSKGAHRHSTNPIANLDCDTENIIYLIIFCK